MTQPDDLIEYMLLEHCGNLEFISSVLSEVRSRGDLDQGIVKLVKQAIRSYGYETELNYSLLAGPIWEYLTPKEVFDIKIDPLFGQKVSFDIDEYRRRVVLLKGASNSFLKIRGLIEEFGRDGFQRAVQKSANDHKWTAIPVEKEASDGTQDSIREGIVSGGLSQVEIEEVNADLEEMTGKIQQLELSQEDKAQALALMAAASTLSQSPSPPWSVIKELIYLIAAISTSLGFVLLIIEKIP